MLSLIQNSINRIFERVPREVLENAWSLFVAFLTILLLLFLGSCQSKEDMINPSVKPLMEAVYASGFVRSQNEYEVFSEGEGYVVEKLVNDGDVVKKGDVLFVLSADQSNARYQIAKQNAELAARNAHANSAVLTELQAALKSAESKVKFDSTNYLRYKNLLERNATTRAEYDRMKLLFDNATNELVLYKSRYRKALNDVRTANENAKQQLLIASDDSGKNSVKSLLNGKVFFTRKDKGELVRRGESLAIIGNANAFYLELSVDELDIDKLKVGQLVLVKADAFAEKVFHAVISKVYPLVDVRQQALRVDAILTDPLPGSFSGLAVEANILIQQKEKALVVPKAALMKGDSVWIEKEGSKIKISVEKGIETMDEVEIIKGVDSTTRIFLNQ